MFGRRPLAGLLMPPKVCEGLVVGNTPIVNLLSYAFAFSNILNLKQGTAMLCYMVAIGYVVVYT